MGKGTVEFFKTIDHDWENWEIRGDERGLDALAIF